LADSVIQANYFFIFSQNKNQVWFFNPNSQSLKGKLNSMFQPEKSHFYPTPCTALWGGGGGAFSADLKIWLVKCELH
jgi:hypothetical protein